MNRHSNPFTGADFYSVTQLAKWASDPSPRQPQPLALLRKTFEKMGYSFAMTASGWETHHNGQPVAYNEHNTQTRPSVLLHEAIEAARAHKRENNK